MEFHLTATAELT